MPNRKGKIKAVIKFALLIALVIGAPAYVIVFNRELISGFSSLDDVVSFLQRYKAASAFIYVGFQILQIVISVIPGQAIQFAAGYLYGFWLGYLLSLIGISLGTTCTFYLARLLGKDAMYLFFGKERFDGLIGRLNKKRSLAILFIIYLIPGLPKDLVGYAAGVSRIKFPPFLLLSLAGRTPALMGSILIGKMVNDKDYRIVAVMSAIFVLLFVIAFIKRKAIAARLDEIS